MCSLSLEQSKTLFVRGLSEDTTEETLRESFEGSVSARIVTDRDTGSSKGYVKHHLGLAQLLEIASLPLMCAAQGVSIARVGDSSKLVKRVEPENKLAASGLLVEGSTCSLLNELLAAHNSVAAYGFAREEH